MLISRASFVILLAALPCVSRSQQGKWVTFSSADGVIADDYTVHMALMARDSSCWFFTNNFLSRRL